MSDSSTALVRTEPVQPSQPRSSATGPVTWAKDNLFSTPFYGLVAGYFLYQRFVSGNIASGGAIAGSGGLYAQHDAGRYLHVAFGTFGCCTGTGTGSAVGPVVDQVDLCGVH